MAVVPDKQQAMPYLLLMTQHVSTLHFSELWPVCQTGNAEETDAKTREFLRAVVEIMLDHITVQNDRTTKIVDFHSPDQLKEVIDFAIPDEPLNLDQLLVDCKDTLKYQVKTGMCEHVTLDYTL